MKPITYLTLSPCGTLILPFRSSATQAIFMTYILGLLRLNVCVPIEKVLANISYFCSPYSGLTQNLVISPSTFSIVFSKYMTDVHSNHTCLSVAPTSFACPLFTNTAGYATRASTGMAILMFVTNANSLLMHHILTTGKMQHIPTP